MPREKCSIISAFSAINSACPPRLCSHFWPGFSLWPWPAPPVGRGESLRREQGDNSARFTRGRLIIYLVRAILHAIRSSLLPAAFPGGDLWSRLAAGQPARIGSRGETLRHRNALPVGRIPAGIRQLSLGFASAGLLGAAGAGGGRVNRAAAGTRSRPARSWSPGLARGAGNCRRVVPWLAVLCGVLFWRWLDRRLA